MSIERLTTEEVLHAELLGHLQYRLKEKVLIAMKDYATQEVEHKTKQLQKERTFAIELLAQCDAYKLPDWLSEKIQEFFHQLNQKNEH